MHHPALSAALCTARISIADLDLLTIGGQDMFTERQNDDYPYKELASQEDFDRF